MLSNSPFHCKTTFPFASMTHGDSVSLHRALPTPSWRKAWAAHGPQCHGAEKQRTNVFKRQSRQAGVGWQED